MVISKDFFFFFSVTHGLSLRRIQRHQMSKSQNTCWDGCLISLTEEKVPENFECRMIAEAPSNHFCYQ